MHRDERSANSNLLPSFEDDNEDSGLWELVCSAKPTGKRKVLFVGNLRSDTTTEKLSQFVTTRASSAETQVKIHECKIFRKEARSSARLVLNSKTAALVNSKGFWPRPVYSRQWNFEKDQPLSDKQSPNDQHMTATDQEPVIDMDAPSQIPLRHRYTLFQEATKPQTNMSSLSIFLTNAFGLQSKFGELQHALRQQTVDIAIVTETKLTAEKMSPAETIIPGYCHSQFSR